jgi:hypothetical protein
VHGNFYVANEGEKETCADFYSKFHPEHAEGKLDIDEDGPHGITSGSSSASVFGVPIKNGATSIGPGVTSSLLMGSGGKEVLSIHQSAQKGKWVVDVAKDVELKGAAKQFIEVLGLKLNEGCEKEQQP